MDEDTVPDNLKKRLALAVRSIQWSYAIFWSISTTNPGVLEWGNGYYNGDIKTRKTVQSVELNEDELGLQRSEQLRELFESLSAGEANPQAKRPSAALSPEDLTDTEWYYLVCMSFVFNIGQGLPGRTLASNDFIWLYNAPFADNKAFTRSLLAKSASIQTVVCFPFLGGVIELGVTEQVMEDLSLIEHVKASFLEIPNPCDDGIIVRCEDLDVISPNDSSEIQPVEDSFMVNEQGASQIQSWQLSDEDFDNCIHNNSLNSSDCISQTILDSIEDGKQTKLSPLDFQTDDLHYQSVLSSLLKTSHPLALGSHFRNRNKSSSFVAWKPESIHNHKSKGKNSQNLLKKLLFEVPNLHFKGLLESTEEKSNRDEKLHEKFSILKSIVPSTNKVDNASILDETIEYVHELQKRVQELESGEFKARKPQDAAERTSDNYGSCKTSGTKHRPLINKRKARDIEEFEEEIECTISKEGLGEISVSINDKEVVIEMKCPWRDGLLLEIMDAATYLKLDSRSVQSSTVDGVFSLTIKSQKGVSRVSAGEIKQTLQRVAWRS